MQRRRVGVFFGVALVGVFLAVAVYPHLNPNRNDSIVHAPDRGTETPDRSYSTSMKQLRERFNQDRGKVRMLLLLSPT